jgi:hypothetical protein
VYTFFVLSFFMDFVPAVRTKGKNGHHESGETEEQMAARDSTFDGSTLGREAHADGGRHYANGHNTNMHSTNGYGNGATNGYGNGATNGYAKPAPGTF